MAHLNESFSPDGPMNNGQKNKKEVFAGVLQSASPSEQTLKDKDLTSKRGLQQNIAVFVAVLCALSFVEGITVTGLPNINISTLETRFGLTSSQAGLISSSGEIGSIVLVLFVSFYGGRSHRPRVNAAGGFVLALGSFFFLLPHVLTGPYTHGLEGKGGSQLVCETDRQYECSAAMRETSDSRFLPMFMVGQALQGIGFTPVFTCGFAYIDDHASPENTAVFIGLAYAVTTLGVGMGYVIGGQFLSLWVDIGRTDSSAITITSSDRRWVGAWWICYAIGCVLYFIISILLCFFPRSMPSKKEQFREQMLAEEHKTAPKEEEGKKKKEEEEKNIWQLLLSFPKALIDLFRNPLYILLLLVGAGDTLIVSGIASFAPKIIEEKFSVNPRQSGLIMGVVTLVGGAGGLGLGGYLIRRFHLRLLGILKMCGTFILLAGVLGGSGFFIHCPEERFAGINSVYGLAHQQAPVVGPKLEAQCNTNCSCSTRDFDPVCGEDGVTYFSPCYAGCLGNKSDSQYFNCACVVETLVDGGMTGNGSTVNGQCATTCPQVWIFVVVLFLGIFFTFLNPTPISMAILRCVPAEERSVGLGLQWVTLRLLGTIPGPILTGVVLDNSCQLWQSTCSGPGSCRVYDRTSMSFLLFIWWAAFKVSALLFIVLAYVFYIKNGHAEVDRQEETIEEISRMGEASSSVLKGNVDYGSETGSDSRSEKSARKRLMIAAKARRDRKNGRILDKADEAEPTNSKSLIASVDAEGDLGNPEKVEETKYENWNSTRSSVHAGGELVSCELGAVSESGKNRNPNDANKVFNTLL